MPSERGITPTTRALILDHYGSTCQLCARGPGDPDRLDPDQRTRLVVTRLDGSTALSDDAPCNLWVLCVTCREAPPPAAASPSLVALMGQLRRAAPQDQQRAHEWLTQQFNSRG